MQEAVDAYRETAKVTSSPRQLEASLLLKAASQLQDVRDSWSDEANGLDSALIYNRRLWTIFVSSMADENNPLPIEIKNNVASLGAFVFSHTIDVQMDPAPEKLEALININKEVAAGLHANA
jgi:flagellar protein FlaF